MTNLRQFKNNLTIVCIALCLLTSQTVVAQNAGTVTFANGDVSITHADKSSVKAVKNDVLNAGDTIETRDGRLQLALIDGGKVSLQPNTIYKINKYEFTGKEDGSEYGFTELVKGGLRTISGLIGHKNRDRYQLKTAVATIGIRGTEFTVNFNDNNLLMTTNYGSVDVCNAGGCLNAITGQSIVVAGVGAAPKPSNKAAKAAAAPPTSNKAVFANSDVINDAGLPLVVTQAVATTQAGGTSVVPGGTGTGSINGNATIMSLATMPVGVPDNNGIYVGTTTFTGNAGNGNNPGAGNSPNGNALKTYTDNSGSPIIITGLIEEAQSDNFVKWGRASGGTYNGQSMLMTNWITGIATPTSAISALNLSSTVGVYALSGFTAPYIINGGNITVGTQAVTANLIINFSTYKLGYNILVPIAGNNFSITGANVALTGGSNKFSDSNAVIGGTAACICTITGSGILYNNAAVEGSLFGPNAQRAGLQYGIQYSGGPVNGNLYGAVVLTKQ